jgi:hypothetical protein
LFFRLCSDHLSIEAIPRRPFVVDFAKMKDTRLSSYELLMWTPHFVVLRSLGGQEITLRGNGRMVVRKAASEESAKQIATEVMSLALRISADEITRQ